MNFSIGLTGLRAAQQALELIGTNLANAGTKGYHRQEIRLSPLQLSGGTSRLVTGGVMVDGAVRQYDALLEREYLRQQPILGQLRQELSGLASIESVMGQVDGNPLGDSMRGFFSALNDMASDPTSTAYAQQIVWSADSTALNFRSMSEFLTQVKDHLQSQAEGFVAEVNALAETVAELNSQISTARARGATPNILEDQRDQALAELADLAGTTVTGLGGGDISVSAWGIALVVGENITPIKIGLDSNGQLGIASQHEVTYNAQTTGGQLGGAMNLHNEIVSGLENKLDTLARQMMYEFNAIQSQGLGSEGSFTSLDGATLDTSETMGQWQPPVATGQLHLRLIDAAGMAETHTVDINSGDTLSDVIDAISLISPGNISANIAGSALHIETANGYKFDFVPDNTLTTDGSDGTTGLVGTGGGAGAPVVETSGVYEGDNQTYNFKVIVPGGGAGEIGVDENLSLEVRNGAGELVKTLDVGLGYAAGDSLEIEDGLCISLGQGTVNDSEDFSVAARSNSDTGGFLVSAGMNTFFRGTGASDMRIRSDFYDTPTLISTSAGPDGGDSLAAQRLARLDEMTMTGLGGKRPMDYFYDISAGIGQQVMVRESRHQAMQASAKELENQRDQISGVNPNEEAAKLIAYEQMFQSMSKFISVQDQAMQNLMDLL